MSDFDYDRLGAFKTIVIEYNGAGDEGSIEDVRPEPPVEGLKISYELERELEEIAYDLLEKHFGGWEINEGSSGTITIDVVARKASIHHGWIIESQEWEDVEL